MRFRPERREQPLDCGGRSQGSRGIGVPPIYVRRAGGRSGILALVVLFGWLNVGLLLLESLVFLTLTVLTVLTLFPV